MLCDYYLIRKGVCRLLPQRLLDPALTAPLDISQRYRITDLYTNAPQGWYYYSKGFNWRAFAAYLIGIAPNMPGFINAVVTAGGAPAPISEIATKIYAFSWFTGVAISMAVYWLLNFYWPAAGNRRKETFREIDESEYEEYGLANSPKWTFNPRHVDENNQYDAELEDSKKLSGMKTTAQVVDVPELRA